MHNLIKKNIIKILLVAVGLIGMHLMARNSYLLFHTVIELFSVIVAFALSTLTWSARRIIDNKYLIIVGLAALFIGILDLLHSLAFQDMNFFPKNTYYANQFWIATRFFESIVLFSGFFFLTKKTKISYGFLLLVYSLITVIIILLILHWKIFPVCYISGVGQTEFKIYSEYIIIFVLCCALYFLIKRKKYFQNEVFNYLLLSVISTIVSEFCFTLYFSNTGLFNEIGHIFKIFSFYFIYKAVIETGFIKPGELLYRNLKLSREKADLYNKQLEQEIATRDKLFSIIAHDLRSPFAVLLAGSEMLYKNPRMFNEEEMQKHHKLLYRASKNTFELLENLLDWTKMKAGIADPYPQSLDLNKMIRTR